MKLPEAIEGLGFSFFSPKTCPFRSLSKPLFLRIDGKTDEKKMLFALAWIVIKNLRRSLFTSFLADPIELKEKGDSIDCSWNKQERYFLRVWCVAVKYLWEKIHDAKSDQKGYRVKFSQYGNGVKPWFFFLFFSHVFNPLWIWEDEECRLQGQSHSQGDC